jgi:hemerythrin
MDTVTVKWDETLATGWRFIDEDHARLVAILNEVERAVAAGGGGDDDEEAAIQTAIADLVAHCHFHFAREEAAMRKSNFAGLADHKAQHEHMRAQILGLERRAAAGGRISPEDIADVVKEWLGGHVRREDRDLARHLARHAGLGR